MSEVFSAKLTAMGVDMGLNGDRNDIDAAKKVSVLTFEGAKSSVTVVTSRDDRGKIALGEHYRVTIEKE